MSGAYGGFAEVYDALMRDVDYDAWADDLHQRFCAHALPVRTVADCACGTGALTHRLFRLGYQVTGLDVSPDMLRVAQYRARTRGLSIPFVCQDMRKLQLHKPVDAVTCACDGVNYLTSLKDVQTFFARAHETLKPGGLFLFDISSRYKLEHVLHGHAFGDAQTDCAYVWSNRFDAQTSLCEMELTCFIKRDMLYERVDERHVQRAHTVEELTYALERAGFSDIRVFDAFTLHAPGQSAERIQFAATATGDAAK